MKSGFKGGFGRIFLFAIIALACGLSQKAMAFSQMYWTDASAGKIQQATLWGASVGDLATNLGSVGGIAISGQTGKIYWTNSSSHKIQFSDLDGNNIKDLVIEGLAKPADIVIDDGNSKIYWTDLGLKVIKRANLDGSNVETVISTGLKLPKAITINTVAGKIYWSDCWYPAAIRRANLDGSNVETIVSADIGDPSGMVLDLRAGKIYWTDAAAATAKIERANLDGSGREQLVTSGLYWPRGIVLDSQTNEIYWTDSWQPGSIKRANLDGTDVTTLVSDLGNVLDIAFTVQQPTSLEISGPSQVYEDSGTQCAAIASYSDGSQADVTNLVTWSVTGNGCASITGTGELQTQNITSTDSITVKAQYTEGGGTVQGQTQVGITLPVSFTITGSQSAKEVAKTQYRTFVRYDNGDSKEVTNRCIWAVQPDTYAAIDTAGLLTVRHIDTPQDITISAQYTRSVSPQQSQIAVHLIPLQTLHVPGQYGTIQAAIDAATDYDTVVIADGTYTQPDNGDISFRGKPLTLKSEHGPEKCIIDWKNSEGVFYFGNGEGPYSVLDGFTIKDSNSLRYAAAILCSYSSPTIKNCVITGSTGIVGAIYCYYSQASITNCRIEGNASRYDGGGIYIANSSVNVKNCTITGNKNTGEWSWGGGIVSYYGKLTVTNCVFASNSSGRCGGAIFSYNSQTTITNSTLVNNSATYGGGIYSYYNDNTTINNSILWENQGSNGSQFGVENASVTVNYCDIDGLSKGTVQYGGGKIDWKGNNINSDPCFINSASDYHLLKGSSCINAGDPQFAAGPDDTDIEGNKRIIRGRVDMGAYEAFYNSSPTACIVGGNQTIEAQGPTGAKVTLDGSCSTDADSTSGTNDDISQFAWYKVDPCNTQYEDLLGDGQQYECNLPIGKHTIALEVTDNAEASNTVETTITIRDTTPPAINCPADIIREATGPDGASAAFAATASDIVDPSPKITYSRSSGSMFPLGITKVTCEASDSSGNSSSGTFNITVIDTRPPDFSFSVTPTTLWPPNSRMVRITPVWSVRDIYDRSPAVSVVTVKMSETDISGGSIRIDADGSIYLRAERSEDGNGRIYTITYQAKDHSGNTTVRSATVTVPHNQNKLK